MDTEGKWNETGGSSFEGGRQELKEKAHSTAERAKTQVRSIADSSRTEVAAQIGGIGRALRSAGDRLREDEHGAQASRYSEMLADRADRVSRYLDEHDAGELFGEVENLARKSPMLFLGGCLAVGFALGRFLKASPEEGATPEQMPLGVAGPSYGSAPGYEGGSGYGSGSGAEGRAFERGSSGIEASSGAVSRPGVPGTPGFRSASGGGVTPGFQGTPRDESSERTTTSERGPERDLTTPPKKPVASTEVIEVTSSGPGYVQPIIATKRDSESGER